MITDTEKELDKIYLSYSKILRKLKMQNIKTKDSKDITFNYLSVAINDMVKKHPLCRWKNKKINGKKFYVLIEGYYWLIYVYFQYEKEQIDADIEFFETRIKQYEELLHIKTEKVLWNEDMFILQLPNYFNRTIGTIYNAISKMKKLTNGRYTYYEKGKCKISKEGIEWLCKNCFKQKYLELLEQYKMELTELYIKAGYPYDNHFRFYIEND